jgi:hypothetical protein
LAAPSFHSGSYSCLRGSSGSAERELGEEAGEDWDSMVEEMLEEELNGEGEVASGIAVDVISKSMMQELTSGRDLTMVDAATGLSHAAMLLRQQIAVAVHRRLLLLPFNLDIPLPPRLCLIVRGAEF